MSQNEAAKLFQKAYEEAKSCADLGAEFGERCVPSMAVCRL